MLEKLSRVLSLFSAKRPELTVLEITKALRWPKSTTYRLLAAIEKQGFLDRDEVSGRYRLGIRLATLGGVAQQSTSLQRITMPVLRRLSVETEETATLMVLVGNEGVTIDVVESHQPLMLPGLLGGRMPLHSSAGGKALLAWASAAQVEALIRPPLARYTSTTITDLDELMRELDTSRRRGYTIVNGETVDDVVGVAAPIRDHKGAIPGVLTVGGPRSRAIAKIESLGGSVMRAAEAVSRSLGHQPELVDGHDGTGDDTSVVRRIERAAAPMRGNGANARARSTARPRGRPRGKDG